MMNLLQVVQQLIHEPLRLIAFHFVITLISRRDGLISIEGIRRTNEKLESKMGADFFVSF
jgi:hypothetical protein